MSNATLPVQTFYHVDFETLPRTILQRIADGEPAAVDECVRQYGRLVWTLAKRFCAGASDAEDASQEIFLEIWQKAHQFDPEQGSEANFISLITRRRLIDRYRKTTKTPEMVNVESVEVDFLDSTDQRLENHEEAAKAADCFRKLPSIQQKVLGLSIHDGVSHGGISEHLAIPLGTTKSYARRGLLQLRECMKRKAAFAGEGGVQ